MGINRQVMASRTGIIIKNKTQNLLMTDTAISSDRNIIQMEAENELKYI
jgi:hypothetical protein